MKQLLHKYRFKTSWHDLDVTQMASWDDAPRRGFLGFMGALLLIVGAFLLVLPLRNQLHVEGAKTKALQQSYVTAVQADAQTMGAQNSGQIWQVIPVSRSDLPIWMAKLAENAGQHSLTQVRMAPVEQKRENGGQPPSTQTVGRLNIQVLGTYADVLKWCAELAAHSSVLSMQKIELSSEEKAQVRAQLELVFALRE